MLLGSFDIDPHDSNISEQDLWSIGDAISMTVVFRGDKV